MLLVYFSGSLTRCLEARKYLCNLVDRLSHLRPTRPTRQNLLVHSAQVFHRLRDLANQQGLMQSGDDATNSKRFLKYYVLDNHVCRDAFASLHFMGVNPRLANLVKAVMEGKEAAPTDSRFLKRKAGTEVSHKQGEVYSYLEGLLG